MEYYATENWIQVLADQFVMNNHKLTRDQGIYLKIEIDIDN